MAARGGQCGAENDVQKDGEGPQGGEALLKASALGPDGSSALGNAALALLDRGGGGLRLRPAPQVTAGRPAPTAQRQIKVLATTALVVSYDCCSAGRLARRVTAGNVTHSRNDHTWSVNPAAIAGVRGGPNFPAPSLSRSALTGQQKL